MKNSLAAIFCSLVLLLSSCGVNDPQTLVGTWDAQSFSADIESTTDAGLFSIGSTTSIVGEAIDYSLTLTETEFSTTGSYNLISTVDIDGFGSSSFTQEVTGVNASGTYSSTDDAITIEGSLYDFQIGGFDFSDLEGLGFSNEDLEDLGIDLDALSSQSFELGEQSATYEFLADGTLVVKEDRIYSKLILASITEARTLRSTNCLSTTQQKMRFGDASHRRHLPTRHKKRPLGIRVAFYISNQQVLICYHPLLQTLRQSHPQCHLKMKHLHQRHQHLL